MRARVRVVLLCGLTTTAFAADALPDDADVIRSAFEAAVTHLHAGQPREALEALATVEQREPDNPWLGFYRGLAQSRLGNAYEAIASFDGALDTLAALGDPEPALADSIAWHRREARRQVFSLSYQAGLAYDTNVSFVGDAAVGLGLVSGRSDSKVGSTFGLHYAPLATEDHALSLAARVGHSWHCEVDEFNYQDYGAGLRYARRVAERWEASLAYDYDMTLLGNESFLSVHALRPGVAYNWPVGTGRAWLDRTGVYYEFAARDFLYPTTRLFERDGVVNAVGVEQRFAFRPLAESPRTGDATLGYRYESVSTEGTEFDRNVHMFYAAFALPVLNPWRPAEYLLLPDKELVFRFNVSWEADRYREHSLLDRYRRKRSDLITTYAWQLSQRLFEHPGYGDIILHALVHWTDANSDLMTKQGAAPFHYDKLVYGVQLEWAW
ncbi:MAG: hypothetical protein JXA69_21180 [Phycisphaerae bacterium]|nr:hypothetical protein [Phycisphaerae bacterium]